MLPTERPARFAWRLRFGCGSLVGIILALAAVAQFIQPGWRAGLIILPIAVGCGLLAARWGDQFWCAVIDSFPWFV